MSKPLARTAPPKRSAQYNAAAKLDRSEAVDPKTIRRTGVNYGQGDEPSVVELKETKKAVRKEKMQVSVRVGVGGC